MHTDPNCLFLRLSTSVCSAWLSLHSRCHQVPLSLMALKPRLREVNTHMQTDKWRQTAPMKSNPLLPLSSPFRRDWLIFHDWGGCENEWGAKRLREGCLKDIDGNNPFTPPPRLGDEAKAQRKAGVSSRAHSQHTVVHYSHGAGMCKGWCLVEILELSRQTHAKLLGTYR